MRPSVTAGTSPLRMCRSVPQMVVVSTLTITSVGSEIPGSGTVSHERCPGPPNTSAFMSPPLVDTGDQTTAALPGRYTRQAAERGLDHRAVGGGHHGLQRPGRDEVDGHRAARLARLDAVRHLHQPDLPGP